MYKQINSQNYENRAFYGFQDSTRSQELLKHLQFLNSNHPSYASYKPTLFQTASKVHNLGIAMVSLGIILTLGTIGGAIVFSGFPLHQTTIAIIIGVVGGSGSLIVFGVSIYCLINREYWKDPAFCQRRAEKLMQNLIDTGYNAVRSTLQKSGSKPELLSKALIKQIITQEHFEDKNYADIQSDSKNDISQLYTDRIFQLNDFVDKLLQESKDLTFINFLQTYKWQPFKDGVISANSAVEKQSFQDRFLLDLKKIESWSGAFKTFPDFWNLFAYKIADGADFYDRAMAAFEEQGFKAMIGQYGWGLLDNNIVAAAEVHDYACQDFEKLGFEAMIKTCGWEVFEKSVVSNKDTQVMESFKAYLREEQQFSSFYHAYHSQALNRGIIPEGWSEKIGGFAQQYGDALSAKSRKITDANQACERAISTAEANKEATLAPWRAQVSSAQSQLSSTSMYTTTYVASTHRHGHGFAHGHSYGSHGGSSMTTVETRNPAYDMAQANLRNAEDALSSARATQEGIFQRAKTDAESTRDSTKAESERVFGQARDQIDGDWRDYMKGFNPGF